MPMPPRASITILGSPRPGPTESIGIKGRQGWGGRYAEEELLAALVEFVGVDVAGEKDA